MQGSSLAGLRVVVTRRAEQARGLIDLLRRRAALPIECPTIRIVPPLTWTPVDDAARRLSEGDFDFVLFTSANAVEHLFGRLDEVGENARAALAGGAVRVGAVGRRTRAALEERNVPVDLVPEVATAEDLGRALGRGAGRVLLPRAEHVPTSLGDVLTANGWTPVPVTVYRTVAADPPGPAATKVKGGAYDAVTFTSASTVRGFVAAFGVPGALKPDAPRGDKTVACIGPVTTAACEEAGLRVDVVASEPSNEALIEALARAGASGDVGR